MVDSITIRFNYDRHGDENNSSMKIGNNTNSNSTSSSSNNQQRPRMRNECNASSGYSSRDTSVHELQTLRSSPIDDHDKDDNELRASLSLAGVTATSAANIPTQVKLTVAKSSPQHSESGRTAHSGASVGTSTGQKQHPLIVEQRAGVLISSTNNSNNSNSNNTNNSVKDHHNHHSIGEHTPPGGESTMLASNHHHHHYNNNNYSSSSSNNNNRHSHCMSPSYSCCQRNEMLTRVNEELVQQNRELEERNHGLSEEIQVSRRFYQGTLADLTAQLSLAENRIKYLKEVVSTQEEALKYREKEQTAHSSSLNVQHDRFEHFTHPPVIPGTSKMSSKSLPTSPRGGVGGGNYHHIDSARSTTSSAGSSTSDISTSRSRLNAKSVARMKEDSLFSASRTGINEGPANEQLLEKNQNLKTDIELLKFKSEVPRSSSVPALNVRPSHELPSIKSNRHHRSKEVLNSSHIIHGNGDEQTEQDRYIIPNFTQEVRGEQKKRVKNRVK